MITQYHKLALTAAFGLALAFTLSCSSGKDDGNDGGVNYDPHAGNAQYERLKERSKYYDPDDPNERCINGAVEGRCEVDGKEVWYSPLTHGCRVGISCGGNVCDTTYLGFGTIVFCGNEIYGSYRERRCQNGVVEYKCGDAWYKRETHYCDSEYDFNTNTGTVTLRAKVLCGSEYYRPSESTRCQDRVVEEKCGGMNSSEEGIWYNEDTHYCSFSWGVNNTFTYTVKQKIRCGNEYFNGDSYRCNNGTVERRCEGSTLDENPNWYNEITQSCNWMDGTVKTKLRCGG